MFSLASGLYKEYLTPPKVSLLVIGCDGAGKTTLLERLKSVKFRSDQKRQNTIRLNRGVHCYVPMSVVSPGTASKNKDGNMTDYGECPSPTIYRKTSDNMSSGDEEMQPIVFTPTPSSPSSSTTDNCSSSGKKMLPLHLIRPTIGMNLAKNLLINKCHVTIWDLSGSESMRCNWERYYEDCHGILFVIDGSCVGFGDRPEKLDEEMYALNELVRRNEVLEERGIPILIFVNKVDERSNDDESRMELYHRVQSLLTNNCYDGNEKGENIIENENEDDVSIEGGAGHGIVIFDDYHRIEIALGSAKDNTNVVNPIEWLVQEANDFLKLSTIDK
mmetsp:Transcript_64710/g.75945  ORF Transcript_64710/g.75945 Transcript_64710/m.75945 type:complete len:331 (-) Transcript_64710:362-1354(-)